MRDKYIELIINYIKERPGYEQALDDIKKEVLALGATENEFDEAMNRITGYMPSKTNIVRPVPIDFINQNTIQPDFKPVNQPKLTNKITDFLKKTKGTRQTKKVIAVLALIIITLLCITQFIRIDNKPKNALVAQNPPGIIKPNKTLIPVVYASSLPVDADKIFSIQSTSKILLAVSGKPKKTIYGFFPYWMMSKADDIALNTLTEISIFGLETDANGNIMTTGSDDISGGWAMWKDPLLDRFIARARSYDLKINLTIKSFNNNNIEGLVSSDTAQKNLIANVLYLVNSKNLDGVNIDFEYVGSPSEITIDGFTRFITNLNAELKRQNPKSTLTIDTYLVSGADNGLFNLPALALQSDAFVIMGYDMHTPKGDAGPVSAMGGDTNIVGYVQNFLEKVDPSKIILAVPYYGYDWPKNQSSGAGDAKILPYAVIADQSKDAQLNWDDTSQTPSFSYKDDAGNQRIVYFDNVRSLAVKYDFINKKNLKGVGIWALGYDGNNQDLQKLLVDKFINQ